MANETLLDLSGDGVNPYSARGLKQTLEPIAVAVPPRTINGGLSNIVPPQFRKFRSTLSCSDTSPPALASLWPGVVVVVNCMAEIAYLTYNGSPVPDRTVIGTREDGEYTYDRLQLTMMVMGPWQQTSTEYAGTEEWSIPLEEV